MNGKRSSYDRVTYNGKSSKFINLDSFLFQFFPTTYHPISKRCMDPQDFDLVADLFSNSTLRRLDRTGQSELPRYHLDRKKCNRINNYEDPSKFSDAFN